jgi:hypothetical protein
MRPRSRFHGKLPLGRVLEDALPAPLENLERSKQQGERRFRIARVPAFRFQLGDDAALMLDKNPSLTNLAVRLGELIGVHRCP